jgi:hypothetical protein
MALISKKDQLQQALEREHKDKRPCVTCSHYEKPRHEDYKGCTKHYLKHFDQITGESTVQLGNHSEQEWSVCRSYRLGNIMDKYTIAQVVNKYITTHRYFYRGALSLWLKDGKMHLRHMGCHPGGVCLARTWVSSPDIINATEELSRDMENRQAQRIKEFQESCQQ